MSRVVTAVLVGTLFPTWYLVPGNWNKDAKAGLASPGCNHAEHIPGKTLPSLPLHQCRVYFITQDNSAISLEPFIFIQNHNFYLNASPTPRQRQHLQIHENTNPPKKCDPAKSPSLVQHLTLSSTVACKRALEHAQAHTSMH